jgi:hypothetical protein
MRGVDAEWQGSLNCTLQYFTCPIKFCLKASKYGFVVVKTSLYVSYMDVTDVLFVRCVTRTSHACLSVVHAVLSSLWPQSVSANSVTSHAFLDRSLCSMSTVVRLLHSLCSRAYFRACSAKT